MSTKKKWNIGIYAVWQKLQFLNAYAFLKAEQKFNKSEL